MADVTPLKLTQLTNRPVISASDILYGVTNPSSAPASVKIPVSAFDNRYIQVFAVGNYGAVGDDATDDTLAIQAAINAAHSAGGGIVFFNGLHYKITANLTLYSNITIQGTGMEVTIIRQASGGQDVLYGNDCSSIIINDITLLGNGLGSLPGSNNCGIELTWTTAGNNPFHNFRNVSVKNCGSDGIRIRTPIVCGFDKVYVAFNGGHGFNWYEGGTSCNFRNCWARQNSAAGYRFNTSVYQSLTGCAADNNGVGYLVQSAQSIGFFGCGAEGQLKNGAPYNGYGFQIDNSSVIDMRACWITDNRNLGVWVTNGSNDVSIQAADNTPNASASFFIQTDVGTVSTIHELHNTTANSLGGTVNIYNDGAGGTTTKTLVVNGPNGPLTFTAATDGGDYNISSQNGNQFLALFGSGGANSLSLQLLDGKFIISTSQTPATSGAAGIAGQIAWDASFIYVCVATNTWKRVAIATW